MKILVSQNIIHSITIEFRYRDIFLFTNIAEMFMLIAKMHIDPVAGSYCFKSINTNNENDLPHCKMLTST